MEFDLNKKHCFYFNEISQIPRGSRNEKAVSDYVVEFAKKHGYSYLQDDMFNVIVEKPASVGYEDSEPIILQAHMDMVCEKNKDIEHDFESDPLQLYVDEEGWLHAKGTTLGADDGMGVAYMLAILDDKSLEHPALQCVFTVMEEIGLLGAINLKKEYFRGKRYINLDSGSEDATSVTSSGGARAIVSRKLKYQPCTKPVYSIKIRGLKGGHSAGKIHMELGNAIILASRVANKLIENFTDIELVDFNGGMKFNAIPREADLSFASNVKLEDLQACAKTIIDQIKDELKYSDEGFDAMIEIAESSQRSLDPEQSRSIIEFMNVIPNGLQHHSMAIPGLSVASLNAGVIYIKDDILFLDDLIRSALPSHGDIMINQLKILSRVFGFDFEVNDRYYGWDYSKDSKLREILRSVLKEKGIKMKESSTHGGLECGIFKGMIPDLDIITYAPNSYGEHTPDEKLDLASFDRTYENLVEVLKRCK